MDVKKIFFALLISALLIGCASAASVSDFNIDKDFKSLYDSEYYSVYADDNQDSGILIFKNVDDDAYDDAVNDDILEGTIQHEGKDYITPDEDMKIVENSDNTTNFTDTDHATHGVSEVVKVDGEEYIVAFWAKDSSNINNSALASKLKEFNKDNKVEAIAF